MDKLHIKSVLLTVTVMQARSDLIPVRHLQEGPGPSLTEAQFLHI